MNTETETETANEKPLPLSERADPSRIQPAEQILRFWHHLVSAAAPPESVLRFDYWSRLLAQGSRLSAGDFVICEPADRSYWVVVRVLELAGEGIVVEHVVSKETMRYQAPPLIKRGPLGTNEEDFEIRRSEEFPNKFAVVRVQPLPELVATKGQPFNRGQCVDWLQRHLITVRRP
jgi:hypothetical protein